MKLSATKRITTESVMTCFEHQWLTQADFCDSQDFDYLVAQELACFDIKVKRGQVCLLVLHYLASIVLPSGQMLEILPKVSHLNSSPINNSNNTSNQDAEIESARAWVATMLADIGLDSLSKPLEATSLQPRIDSSSNFHNASGFDADKRLAHLKGSTRSTHLTARSTYLKAPWYEGVLSIAQKKLMQATDALPSCYQTQVNNHPHAQGKIKLSAQLKQNWHRPHYLYTEQSQFVTDTALVAFLATGWAQLQRLRQGKVRATPAKLQAVNPLPASQWQAVYQQFRQESKRQASWLAQLTPRQVTAVSDGIVWSWWLLTQGGLSDLPLDDSETFGNQQSVSARQAQANHYVQAMQAGQGITRQASSPAIMINMNHAFERWVLIHLASWVGTQLPGSELLVQPSLDWLVSLNHRNNDQASQQQQPLQPQVIQRLTPDACIRDAQGQITHVIDIKYKVIHKPQHISSRDWQQLAVYQQYLQCENGWLIYPKTENFTKRLDVTQNIDDNMPHHQYGSLYLSQMSAIAFDLTQAKLLI